MTNNLPSIRLWCSHFPILGRDYDAKTHRYKANYVNPASYSLVVSAFTRIQYDPNDLEPVRGQLALPPDTIAFDFSINRIGKQFSKRKSKPVKNGIIAHDSELNNTNKPWAWQVDIPPEEGTYDITIKLRNKSGSGPQNTRRLIVHKELLVVSIGDSLASGQGNPDVPGTPVGFDTSWWWILVPIVGTYKIAKAAFEYISQKFKQDFTSASAAESWTLDMNPEPIWLEKNAYRSLRSGAAIAAQRLEETMEGTFVTFLSFARTDSTIQSGLIGPRRGSNSNSVDGWAGNIGQVEEVKRTVGNHLIDALLINIGVNELGVTSTLKALICADAQERSKVLAHTQAKLNNFQDEFWELAQALKPLNIRHTYLIEYPTSLFDKENGQVGSGCGIFSNYWPDLNIDPEDAQGIKEILTNLNEALRRQAERFHWFFVSGIADGFKGRGYCTKDEVRCFVQAEESMILQGNTQGTVHPNIAGHHIIATHIANAVRRNIIFDREVSSNVPSPGGVQTE
jgi:hypothetical protein